MNKINIKNNFLKIIGVATAFFFIVIIIFTYSACSSGNSIESKVKEIVDSYCEVRQSDFDNKTVNFSSIWINGYDGDYSDYRLKSVSWAAIRSSGSPGDSGIFDYESNSGNVQIGGAVTYYIRCHISFKCIDSETGTEEEAIGSDYILYDEYSGRLIYFFKEPWANYIHKRENGLETDTTLGEYYIGNPIKSTKMIVAMSGYDKDSFWAGDYQIEQ